VDNEQIRKYLSPQEIKEALDPSKYLGLIEELIERVLEAFKK
jgi:adenylosuccinate lyase